MTKHLIATTTLFLMTGAAHAHTGHVADQGHGHNHWIAVAIFAGLAIVAGGYVLRRIVSRRSAADTRTDLDAQ